MRQLIYRDWIAVGDGWHDTAQTRLLDDHRWQGDELMDGVVEMFDRLGAGRGRELFEQMLDIGVDGLADAPSELVALSEQINRVPQWLDPERAERGRRILADTTPLAKLGAFMFAVIATATSQDVSAATGSTGRLVNDPIRRAVESHEFFEKVTYHDELVPGSEVFKMVVRVRLMHSLVRRGLRGRWGDENYNTHGMPISNTRLAEGSGWFSSLPLLIDHRLGRRRPMSDHDDVALYWAYILYLFGAEDRIIAKTGIDSLTLANHIFCDAGEESRWRPELMEALLIPVRDQMARGGGLAVRLALGSAAAAMGRRTVQEALEGTEFDGCSLRFWRAIYLALAVPMARSAALADRVPALARWRLSRMEHGDADLMTVGHVIRAYGRRHGCVTCLFVHHDLSTDSAQLR